MLVPYTVTAFSEDLERYLIPFFPTAESRVVVNDVQLILGTDYTIEGNVIIFNPALTVGDRIQVFQ